jgi:hypothetical protein
VLRTNLAPTAAANAFTIDQGTTLSAPTVLGNDADPDAEPLVAVRDGGPAKGTLALRPDGTFTYRPAASFSGTDAFSYHASDGVASSAVVAVTITVRRLAVSFPFSRTLTASRTGRFTFRFKATPRRSATITFQSRAKLKLGSKRRRFVFGPRTFTVPSTGNASVKVRLSRTQLRILRAKRRLTFDVKIVVGQRTFKTTMLLRAPRRR